MKIYKQQEGFTLLEVLIATLVLSIGLLGVAGLQAASLQYGLDAHSRSQVNILVGDILAKMRMQTNTADVSEISEIIDQYTVAPAGDCDYEQAGIEAELNCWHHSVSEQLQSGKVKIKKGDSNESTVEITIEWYEQGGRSYSNDATEGTAASGAESDKLRFGKREFTLTANL